MTETPRKPPPGSKRRVREIIESEPIYMPDEPAVVGTPDSLYDDDECPKDPADADEEPRPTKNPCPPRGKDD